MLSDAEVLPADEHSLIEAASIGELKTVRRALLKGVDPAVRAIDGSRALDAAAAAGQLAVVDALLRQAPQVLNLEGRAGRTALIAAAGGSHLPVVMRLLAQKGVQACLSDEAGDSALHAAAVAGDVDIVRALLSHEHKLLDLAGWRGCTALMLAVSYEHTQVVEALLDYGANARLCDAQGWHALEIAAFQGAGRLMDMLVVHDWELLNLPGAHDRLALIAAIDGGFAQLARRLLSRDARAQAIPAQGPGALEAALDAGHWGLMKALLTAQPLLWDKPLSLRAHLTPAEPALPVIDLTGEARVVEVLIAAEQTHVLRDLLNSNPERLDSPGALGATPLMWAAAAGNKALVRWLLQQRADIGRTDRVGATALNYALDQQQLSCAQLLLDNGAQVLAEEGESAQEALTHWVRDADGESLKKAFGVELSEEGGRLLTTLPDGRAAPSYHAQSLTEQFPEGFTAWTLERALATARIPRTSVVGVEAAWGVLSHEGWDGGVLLAALAGGYVYVRLKCTVSPQRTAYLLGPKTLAYRELPDLEDLMQQDRQGLVWQPPERALGDYLITGYLPYADQAAALATLLPQVPAGHLRFFTGYRKAPELPWHQDLAGVVLPLRELQGEGAGALEYVDLPQEAATVLPMGAQAELTDSYMQVLLHARGFFSSDKGQAVPRAITVSEYLGRCQAVVKPGSGGPRPKDTWGDARGNGLIRRRLAASRAHLAGVQELAAISVTLGEAYSPVPVPAKSAQATPGKHHSLKSFKRLTVLESTSRADLLCPRCELPMPEEAGRSAQDIVHEHLRYSCIGCGCCTHHLKEHDFNVQAQVWQEAGFSARQCAGRVCVACLEEALGRRLEPWDFTAFTRDLTPEQQLSERLLERLHVAPLAAGAPAGETGSPGGQDEPTSTTADPA